MSYFGGMISFELKDDSDAETRRVLSFTKLFSLAESLGGVEFYQSPGEYDMHLFQKQKE